MLSEIHPGLSVRLDKSSLNKSCVFPFFYHFLRDFPYAENLPAWYEYVKRFPGFLFANFAYVLLLVFAQSRNNVEYMAIITFQRIQK